MWLLEKVSKCLQNLVQMLADGRILSNTLAAQESNQFL